MSWYVLVELGERDNVIVDVIVYEDTDMLSIIVAFVNILW